MAGIVYNEAICNKGMAGGLIRSNNALLFLRHSSVPDKSMELAKDISFHTFFFARNAFFHIHNHQYHIIGSWLYCRGILCPEQLEQDADTGSKKLEFATPFPDSGRTHNPRKWRF